MKEELKALVNGRTAGKSIAREYLQARILQSLQSSGAMVQLAFHGGTALRFLHRIPRYSEDLEFSLVRADGYDFVQLLNRVKGLFTSEGYDTEIRIRKKKSAVNSAFVRFPGLLFEAGVSPHRDEVLAVKVEVDTNPPSGAEYETTLVTRYMTLNLHHHSRSTLLAGKLNALFTRAHTKGRDIYDLMWYLSQPDWPSPNLVYLNNALQQFGESLQVDTTWMHILAQRLEAMNWGRVIADVRVFLERQEEMELLTKENILRLLGKKGS